MSANKETVVKKLTFRKYQDGVHTYQNLGNDIYESWIKNINLKRTYY